MTDVEACVICGGTGLVAFPAVLSPFVAERVGRPPEPCRLLECRRCAHRFFDMALDDQELARLYDGYRGESYLRSRQRWEPWYTRRTNQAIGGAPGEIASRRAALDTCLGRWVPAPVRAGAVLDYGGDRGQFIPPELGSARFLYDVSGLPPVEGVVAIRSAPLLAGQRFDLVLLCHVLEHVAGPLAFLRQVQSELGRRSAGHWLYVEVPLERYRILRRPLVPGTAPRRGVPMVARNRLAWLLADFYSTACRVKVGMVPPLGVIKLHEHVAFFTEASLRVLLERAGYQVVHADVAPASGSAGIGQVLRIVGRHTVLDSTPRAGEAT